MMDGLLLVDKPQGWTSFDVVNKIRFMLADHLKQPAKRLKVGHSGTLDPMATGLLVVLVGSYTKRQAEFMKQDKIYAAQITLGSVSDTDDADGKITSTPGVKPVSENKAASTLLQQLGLTSQLPPAYSAIKREGKKAYELARAGQAPKLEPRKVTIHEITDIEFTWPQLAFRTRVSSGTYIRSMARDVGRELKTGGYLTKLRREGSGDFRVESATPIGQLGPDNLSQHIIQA